MRKLFIPVISSKNPNQKGRTDQKYCNNLYSDTRKICKEYSSSLYQLLLKKYIKKKEEL